MKLLVTKGLSKNPRQEFVASARPYPQYEVPQPQYEVSHPVEGGGRPLYSSLATHFSGPHFSQTIREKRKRQKEEEEESGGEEERENKKRRERDASDGENEGRRKKRTTLDDLVVAVSFAGSANLGSLYKGGKKRPLICMPKRSFHVEPRSFFECSVMESNSNPYPATRDIHTVELKYRQRKIAGDEIVSNMRAMLDHQLGITRNVVQMRMHEEFIKSCLPKIYGEEWERDPDSIMMRFGINECRQETIVSMPRRYGKTVGVSSYAAAYALCVPRISVAIFANGHNMSKKLLSMLHTFMNIIGIEKQGLRVTKCQAELIELQGKDKLDKRVVRALCGSIRVCFFLSLLFSR